VIGSWRERQGQNGQPAGVSAGPYGSELIGLRNLIVLIAGLVLIVAGFYLLAKGSITLAPILLVVGYCVAIPVGLIIGVRRGGSAAGDGGE
jgi:hypothetical protein